MAIINDLPTEILVHIFQYYIKTEKQKNLLKCIAKVYPSWKNIVLSSSLWTKYDGTLSFKEMMSLCKKGCLSNTKKLVVSQIDKLESADANKLFSVVKNAEIISFSKVKQFSKDTLSIVARNCSKLKEIKFGSKNNDNHLRLNNDILDTFFAARGSGIVKIVFIHCRFSSLQVLRCMSGCCPNLEYLRLSDISCAVGSTFPTEHFQMHCPKLKVLHLDQNIKIICGRHPSGFPDLEVFTYCDSTGLTFRDEDLECILFNSSKLKFLNLTNCSISATVLCDLPACSLESLYIPRSKVCNTNSLSEVLKKWRHCLKQVDVSYGNNYAINNGISHLVRIPGKSPLEYLNLNFTKITALTVEEVLLNCPHLAILKLEGCRNLSRGMKKTYNDGKEFSDLFAKIKELKSAHFESVETIDVG